MPTDLITIATTAVLSQFLGPGAKYLGEQALERGKQIATKATAYLATVGREPQPVEPKILLPLVQAASLETDKTLAEKWAALLANAADPAQRVEVQPGFAEVLRQLTPMDALVLDYIYRGQPNFSISFARPEPIEMALITTLDISPPEAALSVENIMRLRLGERRVGGFDSASSPTSLSSGFAVVPTIYGQYFMQAVTPPTP